jgi:hypothetical protein
MLHETPGCTGKYSSEYKSAGIFIWKMPTGVCVVTCNIYYRQLAIGNTKETAPTELDGNVQDMGRRGTQFGKSRPNQ